MDLSIIKQTDKIYPYGIGNFMHVALKTATFCYSAYLAMQSWSIVALLYMALLFFWTCNIDKSMSILKHELMFKKKAGKRYDNLVKITFSNPHLRFYYKMMFIVVFILVLKVIGSFIGSMNYVKGFNKVGFRTQLMHDLEVSVEQVASYYLRTPLTSGHF
jgi:hypothetical protein